MRAEDIVDRETFEAWLDEHEPDRGMVVWLAARAALRVLPLTWSYEGRAKKVDLTRVILLRCFSLSDVASLRSTSDRLRVAANAAARAADAANAAADAAYAAYAAAYAAAAGYGGYAAAADAADSVAYVAAYVAAYAEIVADCADIERGAAQTDVALWRAGPSPFAKTWEQIAQTERSRAATSGEESARGGGQLDWTFWVDWYEDVLAGKPRNIPMMEEIALEVDWTKEPGDVLAQIDRIRGKYAKPASYNAEIIREDPADHLIEAVVVTELPEDLHRDVRERVEHALTQLKKAMEHSNLLACMRDLVEELEEAQVKYSATPVRLYEEYLSIADGIAQEVSRDAEIGDARPVQKLGSYLLKGSTEMLSADPQIQERFALSTKAPLLDRPLPDAQQFHEMTERLVQGTKLVLTQEMRVDEAVILDDTAPLAKRRNALYRYGSRAIRIAGIAWAKSVKAGDDLGKLGAGVAAGGGAYWFIAKYVVPWFL